MTSSPCLVVLRGVGSLVSNCFDIETRDSQNSSLAFFGMKKRFLCKKMIVKCFPVYLMMLVLVIAAWSMTPQMTGDGNQAGMVLNSHLDLTVASTSDGFSECCSKIGNEMHNPASSCAIDCQILVPSPSLSMASILTDLATWTAGNRMFSLASARFRPPIAV